MLFPDFQGLQSHVLGGLDGGHVGFVAASGGYHVDHFFHHVHVGQPDVSLRVGVGVAGVEFQNRRTGIIENLDGATSAGWRP